MTTTFAFRDLARRAIRDEIEEFKLKAGKIAEKHGAEYVRQRLNALERKLAYAQEDFTTTAVTCPACGQGNRVRGQASCKCGRCKTVLTPPERVPVPARRTMTNRDTDDMIRKINDTLGGKPWRFEEDK